MTHDPHKGAPTLLPCPFCGSTDLLGDATAVYEGKVDSQAGWYECKACGCTGPSAEVANIGMEPARAIWNTRAAKAQESPAGSALVEELQTCAEAYSEDGERRPNGGSPDMELVDVLQRARDRIVELETQINQRDDNAGLS